MNLISKKITGAPYCRLKNRGDILAQKKWTQTIIVQTKNLPKISNECKLKVIFYLPKDKFPIDYPYGPDLDNLLKRFQDALNETIFSEVSGKDSCIIELTASKKKVESENDAGLYLEITDEIIST